MQQFKGIQISNMKTLYIYIYIYLLITIQFQMTFRTIFYFFNSVNLLFFIQTHGNPLSTKLTLILAKEETIIKQVNYFRNKN